MVGEELVHHVQQYTSMKCGLIPNLGDQYVKYTSYLLHIVTLYVYICLFRGPSHVSGRFMTESAYIEMEMLIV